VRHPPLDAGRLADLLEGTPLRVEVSEADPSTNATAARRAREGAAEGLVVATEHQTAGRGRLDRGWVTPPRSALTFSVLLRPRVDAHRWPWLPLVTGYAVREALAGVGVGAELKWPNDVLVADRKLAGILLERVESDAGPAAVVGIGLNTGLTAEELPVPTATSVLLETGEPPDRTGLLAALLRALHQEYVGWQRDDGTGFGDRYRQACGTLDREVRVVLPAADPVTGRATGIDDDGRLLVDTGSGVAAVAAGDVVHVRPAG
jgi:BirA family biotin operon repressor/biotin-[acetyl-CoA-carboxylase] ligase